MPVRVAARVVLCLLGLALQSHAFAAAANQPVETIRLDDLGKPEARLEGNWQFHAGDSPLAAGSSTPLWAQPAFDDAGWRQGKAGTLDDQNLPYSQFS
jgi:hypothetical protein